MSTTFVLRRSCCFPNLRRAVQPRPQPFLLPILFHRPAMEQSRSKHSNDKSKLSRRPSSSPQATQDAPGSSSPLSLAIYTSALSDSQSLLRKALSTIKPGGLEPSTLESLRIATPLSTPHSSTGGANRSSKRHSSPRDTQGPKLDDLASIIARGRTITVLVTERENYKATLAALQPYNPTSVSSDTEIPPITITVPPVTQESRLHASQRAQEMGEATLAEVRDARASMKKRVRAGVLAKSVRPDEVHRVEKEMDALSEKAAREVKTLVADCRKKLERA